MPTYEYECGRCGKFDVYQPITAKPLEKCPTCKRKVRRLIGTGAGIIFKGSGFYQTDYRSEGYKKSAKEDSGAPAKSASDTTPSGKTETKPADSKSPSKPAETKPAEPKSPSKPSTGKE